MSSFTKPHKLSAAKIFRKFAGALLDDDAIKTSIATSTSVATYTGAALNGVMGALSKAPFGRNIIITTTTASNAYNIVDPIVITGKATDGVTVIAENFTLTTDDGNEIVAGTKAFSSITSIAVPAQAAGTGTFKFGVRNLYTPFCREIKVGVAGNMVAAFVINNAVATETAAFDDGERLPISPVYIDYTSTVQDLVLFV